MNGDFDETLLSILNNYEKINEIILPTLGKDRRSTYSPFLPICEETGKVLQVPINNINLDNGTIEYTNEKGKNITWNTIRLLLSTSGFGPLPVKS